MYSDAANLLKVWLYNMCHYTCKRGKRLTYGPEPGRRLPGPEEIKMKVKMLKITDAIIRPKKNKLSITIIVFEQLL